MTELTKNHPTMKEELAMYIININISLDMDD